MWKDCSRLARIHRGSLPSAIETTLLASPKALAVTQDFFKSGSASRVVNRYVPFFAAKLGEINKLATEFNPRNLVTPEGRKRYATVSLRAGAWITAPSIALYLAQKDDELYQEIPEYLKANAWVIIDRENGPLPFTTRSGETARIWVIPRPHLLGYVFGYMPEKMLASIGYDDPDALSDLAKNTWSAVSPTWIPTIALPLIENYSNKSTFTGRPIVPRNAEGLEPVAQSAPRTGETARLLSQGLDKVGLGYSPAKMENIARAYTGGAGMTAKEVLDGVIRNMRSNLGQSPLRVSPANSDDPLDRVPVVGRFITSEPGSNAKSVEKLFSEFDDAERKRLTFHSFLKQGKNDEANDYLERHRDQIMSVATKTDVGDDAEPGELRAARKAMGDLTQARRELAASDASPLEKATSEREIEREMMELARAYYSGTFKETASQFGLVKSSARSKQPRRPAMQFDSLSQAFAEQMVRSEREKK